MPPEIDRVTMEPFAPEALTALDLPALTRLHDAAESEADPGEPPRPPAYVAAFYAGRAKRSDVQLHDDTGVEPAVRGRGMGRWLNAAMLLRMLDEHPERREVRTGNADAKARMLSINDRLGFRPWLTSCVWQASVPEVEAALSRHRTGDP